jgi:cytochrome c
VDDRANTVAGWALAGMIAALGLSIVSGEYFHTERPEKMGYIVEGVEEEGAADAGTPAQPIETFLATADPSKGEQVFKKCAACHNAEKGGANALGPNLWGVLGEPVGKGHGFPFSDALAAKGGAWNWQNLNEWLESPKKFAPGTKMTFAGLSKPEDRANVMAFLNARSDAPQPLPAAPAAGAAAAMPGTTGPAAANDEAKNPDEQAAEAVSAGAQKAKDQPVQTEAQAAVQPKGNIRDMAAPAVNGTSQQQK